MIEYLIVYVVWEMHRILAHLVLGCITFLPSNLAAKECADNSKGDVEIKMYFVATNLVCPEGYKSGKPCTGIDGRDKILAKEFDYIIGRGSLIYENTIPPDKFNLKGDNIEIDGYARDDKDIEDRDPKKRSVLYAIHWPCDDTHPLHRHNFLIEPHRFLIDDDSRHGTYNKIFDSTLNNGNDRWFHHENAAYFSQLAGTFWRFRILDPANSNVVQIITLRAHLTPEPKSLDPDS